jgi:hypothetical protein
VSSTPSNRPSHRDRRDHVRAQTRARVQRHRAREDGIGPMDPLRDPPSDLPRWLVQFSCLITRLPPKNTTVLLARNWRYDHTRCSAKLGVPAFALKGPSSLPPVGSSPS